MQAILDFYQEIGRKNSNALDDMAQLILEARSLIERHGDGRRSFSRKTKLYYENEDSYNKTLDLINARIHFRLLRAYYFNIDCVVYKNPENISKPEKLTADYIYWSMQYGSGVLARSITMPTGRLSSGETTMQFEIRKILRKKGIPTNSHKPDNVFKEGFPERPTSLIGWGSSVYRGQGFLIINPDSNRIRHISDIDIDSGYGKNIFYTKSPNTHSSLKSLRVKQKMGGSSRLDSLTHTEVIYDIDKVDAIFYSPFKCDPTPYKSYLLALVMQNEYKAMTGVELPIFKYSWIDNTIKESKQKSKEEILLIWQKIAEKYLKKVH